MFDHKADVRPRHRKALHCVERSSIFSARAAQEFAARGHIAEEVFNPHPCAMWQGGRPLACHNAMVDRPRPAFGSCGPAFQRHCRDAGN